MEARPSSLALTPVVHCVQKKLPDFFASSTDFQRRPQHNPENKGKQVGVCALCHHLVAPTEEVFWQPPFFSFLLLSGIGWRSGTEESNTG